MSSEILILGIIVVLVISILMVVYLSRSLPKLPPHTNKIIKEVIASDLPSLKGQEGYAYNGKVKIWYESILPPEENKGTIMLIMGLANDAMAWPDYFIDALVDLGYRVIRMDNRGTGMSDWMKNWKKIRPYTLEDMARDVLAVMDQENIDRCHLVGISMGGMIAQSLAIHHPQRVLTLTSIMSSGYTDDKSLPPVSKKIMKDLAVVNVRYGSLKTESGIIKMHIAGHQILRGDNDYKINVRDIARFVLYNYRERKGDNPFSFMQQALAIKVSGSRYEGLKKLQIPTLIIHGVRDPLIPVEHGKKCYELIPGATALWIDDLGHDIPESLSPLLVEAIHKRIKNQTSEPRTSVAGG